VGIATLPDAGRFSGAATLALWRNPTELLLVTPERAVADAVLDALPPAPDALAYAVDQSDGLVTLEVRGRALDDVLHRLLDAHAVPLEPGQGTRARLADIAVFALRLAPDRAWLMADRANDRFLAHWMAHAADALPAPT
jgi:sarcosine oxidase gamma subunit